MRSLVVVESEEEGKVDGEEFLLVDQAGVGEGGAAEEDLVGVGEEGGCGEGGGGEEELHLRPEGKRGGVGAHGEGLGGPDEKAETRSGLGRRERRIVEGGNELRNLGRG